MRCTMKLFFMTFAASILVANVASDQDTCRSLGKSCSVAIPCCGKLECVKGSAALGACREGKAIRNPSVTIQPTALRPSVKAPVREAKNDSSGRWPNGVVPYVFGKGYRKAYDPTQVQQIQQGMREMEHLTNQCVKFIERTTESDYVEIYPGYECSSDIGRIGGVQKVSLPQPCLLNMGDIQHELMHALGFYHEHARMDRDNYITVNWENVSTAEQSQFAKKNFFTFGLPYDYDSIMHYSADAFAKFDNKRQLITLTSKTNPGRKQLGHHENLSPLDIERIKLRYGCRATSESRTDLRGNAVVPWHTTIMCVKLVKILISAVKLSRQQPPSRQEIQIIQIRTFGEARTFCREKSARILSEPSETVGEFFKARMYSSALDGKARIYVDNCFSISPVPNVNDPKEEDCITKLHFICSKRVSPS